MLSLESSSDVHFGVASSGCVKCRDRWGSDVGQGRWPVKCAAAWQAVIYKIGSHMLIGDVGDAFDGHVAVLNELREV